ncbi:3-hydroxyacyl-ACP dehydratase [Geomonas nitrogeniifigens]|uniref:3-hydroxyacyl-ACP dehydratase n=1 Tax=Geomonas diazotrophica TaxID=2843197 RepID=A0ABX8JIK8_9BACT|nr:acyl-CoA dehydratase activase [Geomonas nitrogeniifigens]QWV97352.1 3-hydroxyacyl-ACP dehydratase [Geomonas nitrogeniifigens]QXE86510.1 3-hydroxyacyl-ACP dehydratase [Geomonas nitrogeniifigens]
MQVGIDLGSRTIKTVTLKGGAVLQRRVVESGFEPHRQALKMLGEHPQARVVATGYGRHLMQQHADLDIITEIKAHALGARHLFPHCRTVLDVGGQDSKVIQLSEDGRIVNFQMNDKCAAGTGRFLEMMAVSLGYGLTDFGSAAAEADAGTPINSMCAVFAESEVISLKNRGIPPAEIARSVHLAVASRLAAMVSKTGECRHLVFTGGVANNTTLVAMLENALGVPVLVPEDPSITGALGAALHAGCS